MGVFKPQRLALDAYSSVPSPRERRRVFLALEQVPRTHALLLVHAQALGLLDVIEPLDLVALVVCEAADLLTTDQVAHWLAERQKLPCLAYRT